MEYKLKDDELIIYLEGNIDYSKSREVDLEINQIIKENGTFNKLTLDAMKLDYISSAGLRIVLSLVRAYQNFSIINANSNVYEVFEMTGFTNIATIKRAMRELDISNAVKIGEGAKGIVYRYSDDIIVKVFKLDDQLEEIEKERELSRKAFILGIPTAISFDVALVNGKHATVYELLKSNSMSELIVANPDKIDFYASEFARLLKQMNETQVNVHEFTDAIRTPRTWLERIEGIIPNEAAKITKLLDNLSHPATLVHGDFHSNNVMLQNNEFLVIDMDTLKFGNPIIDLAIVAFSYKVMNKYVPTNSKDFLGIPDNLAQEFYKSFINHYFADLSQKEILDKCKKIEFLSTLRAASFVFKKNMDQATIDLALNDLKEALKDINDLNL